MLLLLLYNSCLTFFGYILLVGSTSSFLNARNNFNAYSCRCLCYMSYRVFFFVLFLFFSTCCDFVNFVVFSSCRTETIPGNPSYKATMRLHIQNVQKSDYGSYKCVAKNPRGEMDGTIKLYSKFKCIICTPSLMQTAQAKRASSLLSFALHINS